MAVQFNVNQNSIPTFPTVRPALPTNYTPYKPYNPKQNTYDPEAYYTKALGFLPIDTRYLSNTTNSLAYNSMADVIFNKGAIEKRWGDSRLSEWYGYIPRLFIDTGLLLKDTIIDPVVQGVIDDGWAGFVRGASTGLMNTLVNFGNTLDILSNPIKGLVLDGEDGFFKGLIGDEHGRKQYDYMDYIDTGNGFNDFILSMLAEMASDPLTYVSFGASGAAKSTGQSVSKTILNNVSDFLQQGVKVTADDVLENAVAVGTKKIATNAIDDLIAASGESLSKKTAAQILADLSDDAGQLIESRVKNFISSSENLTADLITNNIRKNGILSEDVLKRTAESLTSGKATRYKAGLVKGVHNTETIQRYVSEMLPTLALDNLPSVARLGIGINRFNYLANKSLNTLGSWGSNFALTAAARKSTGFIKDAISTARLKSALKQGFINDTATLNTLKQFEDVLGLTEIELPDLVKANAPTVLSATKRLPITSGLDNAFEDFYKFVGQYGNGSISLDELLEAQEHTVKVFNDTVKRNTKFKTLTEYIEYISKYINDVEVNPSDYDASIKKAVPDLKVLRDKLKGMNNILSQDFHDNTVQHLLKKQGAFYNSANKLWSAENSQPVVNDDILNTVAEVNSRLDNTVVQLRKLSESITDPNQTKQVVKELDTITAFQRGLRDNPIETIKALQLEDSPYHKYIDFFDDYWLENNFKHFTTESVAPKVTQQFNIDEADKAFRQYRKKLLAENRGTPTVLDPHILSDEDFEYLNYVLNSETGTIYDLVRDLNTHYTLLGNKVYPNTTMDITSSLIEQNPALSETFEKVIYAYQELQNSKTLYETLRQAGKDTKADIIKYIKAQIEFADIWDSFVNDNLQGLSKFADTTEGSTNGLFIKYMQSNPPEVQSSAVNIQNYINQLTTFNVHTFDDAVNLVDYNNAEAVSYVMRGSQTRFALELVNSFEKGFGKLLEDFRNPNSVLNQLLNNPAVDEVVDTADFKLILSKQQSFKTLTEDLTKLAQAVGLDEVHTEGLIDAIVSEINKNHKFVSWKLNEVAENIYNTMNLYFATHIDAESYSLDTLLRKAIAQDPDNPIVQNISARLKTTHAADTDVLNLTDLIKLNGDVHKQLSDLMHQAGKKYQVVFDIETTGTHTNSKIFQIAVSVLDENGTAIDNLSFNYKVNPGTARPDMTVLKKLTPDGIDPEAWWQATYVNADDMVSISDAMQKLKNTLTELDTTGGYVFVGHNIEAFDIPKLIDATDDVSLKQMLESATLFDTYTQFVANNMFSLTDDTKNYFIAKLTQLLDSDAPCLRNKLFTPYDVRVLSDFKKALRQMSSSVDEHYANIAEAMRGDIETSLDGVVEAWNISRSISKKDFKYYTVSKVVGASEVLQKTLDDLVAKGFINIPDQYNIMTYLNRNVAGDGVFLNPATAISYKMFDVFSLDKLIEQYGSPVINRRFAEQLTRHSRAIQRNKTWLTSKMVDNLLEPSKILLQGLQDDSLYNGYIKLLYNADTMDPTTLVASALYYRNKLKQAPTDLKLLEAYNMFDDLYRWDRYSDAPSKFVTKQDPLTGKPVDYYASDQFDYVKIVKGYSTDDGVAAVSKYITEHNLYNAHQLAVQVRHHDDMALAKEVNTALKGYKPAKRMQIVSAVKNYEDTYLVQAAKDKLLRSENRVQRFIDEAYLYAGRTSFIDEAGLDLSDFKQAGIIVYSRKLADNNGRVEYFLGLPEDLFKQSNSSIRVGATVTARPNSIPENIWNVYKKKRQYDATSVANISTSHGDILTRDLVENFDAHAPAGFSDRVVSIDYLLSEDVKFFNTTRANNMIIGDYDYLSQFDEFFVRDPFKRTFRNTEAFIQNTHNDFTSYLRLLINDANGLKTSDLFKALEPTALRELFRDNPDMHAVIIRPAKSKWRATSTLLSGEVFGKDGAFGYILEEVPTNSVKALEYAKKLNAHILSTEQFLQINKAINKWELPTIAKVAKGISSMYAVGMLGATGFIVRNLIDSNYKNRWALDGVVSLPKQIKHLWNTYHLIAKYNDLGKIYSSALGKYFTSDLDYSVLYHYVKNFSDPDIAQTILKNYDAKLEKQVLKRLNALQSAEALNEATIKQLQKNLLEPELFDVVNMFIQHGPSVGLSRSIYNNIASMKADKKVVDRMINFYTNGPAKLVFNANDMVEQSARLSLFLQRLDMGDGINDALAKVIQTHFDYSDKTLAMLYAEIIFPFMSFSYKNMNFWLETLNKNPMLSRELENILRTCFDYQSLWEPNQEVYENYDYSFDWEKDVRSFGTDAPWQIINAARLFHLLQGNIVISTGKTAERNNGYGEQTYELYRVFKLSPSVIDAVSMLYNPIDVYSKRTLPPYEILSQSVLNVLDGKAPFSDISVNTVLSSLPFIGAPLQRLGNVDHWTKSNNINRRIEDVGLEQAVASVFTAAYVSKKENKAWYDAAFNYLNKLPNAPYYNNAYYNTDGGFTPNYTARRYYQNPYTMRNPQYALTKAARSKQGVSLYAPSKKEQTLKNYPAYYSKAFTDRVIKSRVKDYKYYY